MWRLFSFALSENRPPCRQRVLFIKQQTGTAARLFLYFIQLADNMELNRTTNLNFDTYNSLTPNWYYKVLR